MPPAVAVIGPSGSGKTTLLERLILELRRRGRRIGAVKHSHHEFQVDRRGKDSFRLFEAGAEAVLFASTAQLALVKRVQQAPTTDLDTLVARYFDDGELVLVEGWSQLPLPKIEIVPPGCAPAAPPAQLLAVVGPAPVAGNGCPHFASDDIDGLADFLERLLAPV